MDDAAHGPAALLPCILVLASHDRARMIVRNAFNRRRHRVVHARDASEFTRTLGTLLVDAAVVDVAHPVEDTWRAASLAREFPSIPFFALGPLRAGEVATLARCVELDFHDLLVEGVDDAATRALVVQAGFSSRFARALAEPLETLHLTSELHRRAWRAIVAYAGRAVRTGQIADVMGMTREHLSRTFSAGGAPNLKRVIDLVRLLAAAELTKNPGYDVRDVAKILGFASASHLTSTAQRVVGTRGASLSRLRAVDLVERFAGRARSRAH